MYRQLQSLFGAGLISICCHTGVGMADDNAALEAVLCDSMGCDGLVSKSQSASRLVRHRVPAMLGDFFGGAPLAMRGGLVRDRLFVFADDLDAPAGPLNGAVPLSISEAGPVGIYETSLFSVQQAASILQASGTLPGVSLVGVINDNATLTTTQSIGQIQTQLAGTAGGYDVIALNAPPASYAGAVQNEFQSRVGDVGNVSYDSASSGALLQGGADTLNGGEDLDAYYFYDYTVRLDTSLANAASGGVGGIKLSEGGVILPQDRVFFRYSYFHNVDYGTPSQSLNRFTPGFEKAFAGGLFSVEMRLPFVADAATESVAGTSGVTNQTDADFGNLMVYLKTLLWETDKYAFVAGLGLGMPTAADVQVQLADGTDLLRVENDAVQIQPFWGWLYVPSDRWFAQGFSQFSFSTGDNSVAVNQGNGLQHVGDIGDPSYYFSDLAVGCWAYRNDRCNGLTAVIPTLELHQAYSLDEGEYATTGNLQIGNFYDSTANIGGVMATTFEFNRDSQLTVGYSVPLNNDDSFYDGAFRFQYNRVLR